MLSNTCLFRQLGLGGIVELRLLRYFVATVDAGTVSGASQRLHVTQPGLSRQLRSLETLLGVTLFDRTGGRLTPSSAGRALLPMARDLLNQSDAFQAAAQYYATGGLDHMTIGAPTVTLTDVVAPFVATLAADDPSVDVLAADGRSSVDLLGQQADLAIGTARPGTPFTSRPLAVLPVWAFVPPAHPWAARTEVTLTQLLTSPLIGLPSSATARQAMDAEMTNWDETWRSFTEAANGTLAQALAAAGRGVAVVSDDSRYDLVPLAITLPDDRRLSIRLVTTWHSGHAAAPTLDSMARRLSEFVCARYEVPAA